MPTTEEGDSNKATSEKAPTGSQRADGASNKATPPAKAPTGSAAQSPTDLTRPNRRSRQLNLEAVASLFARRFSISSSKACRHNGSFRTLLTSMVSTLKYHSVRRFVAKLNQVKPLPFRRIEVAAGEEAQVDFGTGAPIVDEDGKRRRTHVLRVVLSHSRKAYSESVFRQTTENFIRCIENAFRHFGGVPKTLVPDNLKAAVLNADWYDPELNPKLRSFCEHYGTVLLPTKPRTPRHKGKVERGVDYVQENALERTNVQQLARTERSLAPLGNDHR